MTVDTCLTVVAAFDSSTPASKRAKCAAGVGEGRRPALSGALS